MKSYWRNICRKYSSITKKMNVIIYSGPGAADSCVTQALETFRLLLQPYYSVTKVNDVVLSEQPWELKTALLIIPGGADLPICRLFKGKINDKIKKYVSKGGRVIGICSGGYYLSGRCEFEVGNPDMEVSGPRDLRFFPGICRGGVKKGFQYASEAGARAVNITADTDLLPDAPKSTFMYLNGGGLFVDAHNYSNVETLATFTDPADVADGTEGKQAAAVLCHVGRGKVLLFGPHPEYNPYLLDESNGSPEYSNVVQTLKSTNNGRLEFLRSALKRLEMKVTPKDYERPKLTPMYFTSIDKGENASKLLTKLESHIGYEIQNIMNIGNDRLAITKSLNENISLNDNDENPALAIKNLVLCDGSLPTATETPYFDMSVFENCFKQYYEDTNQELTPESIGHNLIYGTVVTSTQALMDSNHKWLPLLPSGFTITSTIQVLGRGRSGNVWVNPKGVLPVSITLKLNKHRVQKSPVVFVQYIASMAYTQAILDYADGYEELPVKIKWPNDIYIKLPEYIGKNIDKASKDVTHAKIGGVLVNTNFIDDNFFLVVGAGLNVDNVAPSTSINIVVNAMNDYYASIGSAKRLVPMTMEKILAKFLSYFNQMYEIFKVKGFEYFLPQYYNLWFHSNQIVTLNDKNKVQAQICGITPDWGMLMARDLKTGEVYQLQPDGNSFDMFNGLISQKR